VRLSSVVGDFGQAIWNSAHVPEHGGRITSTSSSVLADADRIATSKREVTNQRLAVTPALAVDDKTKAHLPG
jgi:hypothetical protein